MPAIDSTYVLCAEDPATCRKCLVQLAIFLCHKFPRVRKYTADKFYEALLTYSDRDIIPGERPNITLYYVELGTYGTYRYIPQVPT